MQSMIATIEYAYLWLLCLLWLLLLLLKKTKKQMDICLSDFHDMLTCFLLVLYMISYEKSMLGLPVAVVAAVVVAVAIKLKSK